MQRRRHNELHCDSYKTILLNHLSLVQCLDLFVEELFRKNSISQVVLIHYQELQTSQQKHEYLAGQILDKDGLVKSEFIQWLKSSNQHELINKIFRSLDTGINSQATDEEGSTEISCQYQCYQMSEPTRGLALVISIGLSERNDVTVISQLMMTLSFEVKCYKGITISAMKDTLEEERLSEKRHDQGMLFLFVQSASDHDRKVLHDRHNRKIHLQDIIATFDANNCPALAGKPKFIFFDLLSASQMMRRDRGVVCQENSMPSPWNTTPLEEIKLTICHEPPSAKSTDDESLKNNSMSTLAKTSSTRVDAINTKAPASKADFLILYSSFPGYTGLTTPQRDLSNCVFTFTEIVRNYYKIESISDMLTRIRKELSQRNGTLKQVPTVHETLTKELYLHPLHSHSQ